MAYVIPKAQPTIVKGEKGEYLLPAMSQLGAEQLGDILNLTQDVPGAEKVKIAKEFLLRVCPELEQEELGDWGFFQMYRAYEQEQNPGK